MLVYEERLKDSMLGRMETRLKIVSLLTVVIIFVSLKDRGLLALGVLGLAGAALATGIRPSAMVKKMLWLLPFTGLLIVLFPFFTPGEPVWTLSTPLFRLAASGAGVTKAVYLALRVVNAALAVSLLVQTTPLSKLLHGFRQLRLPGIMVSLVAFTLRYVQVFHDEIRRMQLAMKARGFRRGRHLLHRRSMQVTGLMLGSLFLRSYQRGERIYLAMLSRGYHSDSDCCGHCPPGARDWLTGTALVAFGLGLKLAEWRGLAIWL